MLTGFPKTGRTIANIGRHNKEKLPPNRSKLSLTSWRLLRERFWKMNNRPKSDNGKSMKMETTVSRQGWRRCFMSEVGGVKRIRMLLSFAQMGSQMRGTNNG